MSVVKREEISKNCGWLSILENILVGVCIRNFVTTTVMLLVNIARQWMSVVQ